MVCLVHRQVARTMHLLIDNTTVHIKSLCIYLLRSFQKVQTSAKNKVMVNTDGEGKLEIHLNGVKHEEAQSFKQLFSLWMSIEWWTFVKQQQQRQQPWQGRQDLEQQDNKLRKRNSSYTSPWSFPSCCTLQNMDPVDRKRDSGKNEMLSETIPNLLQRTNN